MILRLYEYSCIKPSDINEHMHTLFDISIKCSHITEMGVRNMVSTWAFLAGLVSQGRGTYVGIDIADSSTYGVSPDVVGKMASNRGVNYKFHVADTLKIEIEPTEFLFLDTEHTKKQVSEELELHASKVSKFIGFHDTLIPEVKEAVEDFLNKNKEWKMYLENYFNSGLIIIKRI